jgi:hypothetical protein
MGYTVARLEPGISSHNNEHRPILTVPPALHGLMFTQVVACRVSPVEIDFESPGKLYVLVGTDWEGRAPLTSVMDFVGVREPMPPLQTPVGGFEVWSLEREAGDRMVLPTQAMLVARELVPS